MLQGVLPVLWRSLSCFFWGERKSNQSAHLAALHKPKRGGNHVSLIERFPILNGRLRITIKI
jgi:hypothetical protein